MYVTNSANDMRVKYIHTINHLHVYAICIPVSCLFHSNVEKCADSPWKQEIYCVKAVWKNVSFIKYEKLQLQTAN